MKTPSPTAAKAAATYAGIFLLFAVIAFGFAPQLLTDKVINQSDRIGWTGVSKEAMDYNNAHPDDKTLWSNSMFSGMPTTTFYGSWEGNLLGWLNPVLDKSRPGSYLLISLIGSFLMMLAFGAGRPAAVIGAVAVTLCSYNIQIIQAGHNTKMLAIAYMPWVMAAIAWAYSRKSIAGQVLASALFAVALSLQIQPNHPQITYYLAIIVLAYAVTELIISVREGWFRRFAVTSALLLVVGLCGVATVSNKLIPLFEYTEYTMRGGSGLEDGDKGLDIGYATAWSYGINEMPNLMIPDFNGGSSHGSLDMDSATGRLLASGGAGNLGQIMNSLPLYWGPQPFTVGPMYLGAVTVMLALLGLMISKDRRKWWLLAVSLLAILLAWGSHIMWFTELMFKYLPFYNKFRTVSMALVVLQITTPLLAVMGIQEFVANGRAQMNKLYAAAGIVGGIALLVSLFPGIAGDFTSPADSQYGQALAAALRQDRIDLLRADAFRSLLLTALAAAALVAYKAVSSGKKKGESLSRYSTALYASLLVLVLFDLGNVGKRYLNENNFISRRDFDRLFAERPADQLIHRDTALSYRVADLSSGVFNDSFTSYHHKNIGGYSPAKMSSYQNIIDRYLTPELNSVYSVLGGCATITEAQERLPFLPVLSMLNCKYLIVGGEYPPVVNNWALGNAWFVRDTVEASGAADALEKLAGIDPRTTAVVERGTQVKTGISPEEPGTIVMTGYSPKRLRYASSSQYEGLAAFSEIYYPAGWKAYIDGRETEILCVNYLLRGLEIPAGEHEILFEFDPQSFHTGKAVSLAASSVILAVLAAGLLLAAAARRKSQRSSVSK